MENTEIDFRCDMLDLIHYAQDNLDNAEMAVGDEGCAVLEGLLGAQRRVSQAIELYFSDQEKPIVPGDEPCITSNSPA